MHFRLLLKGLQYELRLWEGYEVLLIIFQRRICHTFFLSAFYFNDVRNREKTSSRFLPHAFCCSTSSPKKTTTVVPPPLILLSEYIWEYLALSGQLFLASSIARAKAGITWIFSPRVCVYCLLQKCPCVLENAYCPCSAWKEAAQTKLHGKRMMNSRK